MPAKNLYVQYKGYKLYCPMAHDLLKDSDGRYVVYAVLSRPWSNTIERFVVPQCFASTLRDAERLSIEHAKRLVDERMPLESMARMPGAHRKDGYAG